MKATAPAGSLVTDPRNASDTTRAHEVFLEDINGNLSAVWASEPRSFLIHVGGQRYEHVSTTPDGQWVYRAS